MLHTLGLFFIVIGCAKLAFALVLRWKEAHHAR